MNSPVTRPVQRCSRTAKFSRITHGPIGSSRRCSGSRSDRRRSLWRPAGRGAGLVGEPTTSWTTSSVYIATDAVVSLAISAAMCCSINAFIPCLSTVTSQSSSTRSRTKWYAITVRSCQAMIPTPSIGGMLRRAWEQFIGEVWPALHAAGFDDLRVAHRPILRNILREARPTEVAASLGLQAGRQRHLARVRGQGLHHARPDPDDGRAKRIKITERGRALASTIVEARQPIIRRWAEQVGEDR